MADTREDIMSRLVAILKDIDGVDEVSRNVLVADDGEDRRKRVTVLEGEEMIDEEDQARTGNRPANAPTTVHMQPQIELSNFATSDDVGLNLSRMRAAVIKKISADSALIAMTSKGRGGIYIGMASDLAFGREMSGQMTLKFQFTYLLRPDQL